MKYPKILEASKAQQIDALIDGLPVVGNGFFFNEEMMNNVEAALVANTTHAERITELENQLSQANAAKKTAEDALATANQTIIAKDGEVGRLNAELNTAAADFQNTHREKDNHSAEKPNYALSEDNPINQYADSILGKPSKK